jgi:drug/metabolite transporter (DMT)-like permease
MYDIEGETKGRFIMLFVFFIWLILTALLIYKHSKQTQSILLNCLVVFIGYLLIFEGIAQIEKHPYKFIWFLGAAAICSVGYVFVKFILRSESPSNKMNM